MLLLVIAGAALGTMPVPQFAAKSMDVAYASVLADINAPMVTWADLTVDPSGQLVRCAVPAPSKSRLFDRVACDRATRFARFAPARDEAGQPVAALVRRGFAINGAVAVPDVDFGLAVDRAAPGTVADLRVVADAGGKVETCAVDRPSGSAALDRLACTALTGLVRPVVRDAAGTPVRAMSRVSVGFSTGAVSPK